MKKIFALLAFAALVFVGCNKNDDKQNGQLPTPPNQENHFNVTVNGNVPVNNPNGEEDQVKGLGVSSGKTAYVEFLSYGKAMADYEMDSASKVVSGSSFHVAGVGTFTINDISDGTATLSFVPEGGSSITVSFGGTFVNEPYDGNDICRDWKVDETIIKVTGDGISSELGMAKSFNGCNIHDISVYLRDKGVKIDEQSSGYIVKRVVFFENGGFAILFNGEKPFYGPFSLGKSGEFTYDFTAEDASYDDGNPILSGKASGSFNLPGNGKGRLELNCVLKSKEGKAYSVNVIFFLLPA